MNQEHDQLEPNSSSIGEDQLSQVFRAVVLQSPVSTWIADMDGTLVFENAANRRQFGIERDEEVVGRYNIFRDEEIIRQGLAPRIRRVFEEGGSAEFIIDYDFSRVGHVSPSHPTHKVLRVFLFPVKDEHGEVRFVVVQHEDYTEKFRTQRALEQSEARYRDLLENTSDWVWELDLDARYTYSNAVVEQVLGYKPEEVVGRSALDFICPEDADRVARVVQDAVRERSGFQTVVHRMLHADGSVRIIESSGRPILDDEGSVTGFRGMDRDVTRRVRAEEALADAEAKYRSIMEESLVGVYVIQNGKLVYANPRLAEILGYESPAELEGREVLDTVVPEDRDKVVDNIQKRMTGEVPRVHYSFRALRRDGQRIVVEVLGVKATYRHEAAIIGSMLDITERVRAEEQVRSSEAELRTLLSAMPDAVFVLDRNGTYLKIPSIHPELLYRPADVLVGRRIQEVLPEPISRQFMETINRALDSRETTHLEYRLDIDGSETWFEAAVSPMDDKVVWVARDVTERNRAEQALRRSEENFRAIFHYAPALIITYDQHAVVLEVNQAFERFTGYTREQVTGRSMFETFAKPEVMEKKEDVIGHIFSGETLQEMEWVAVRPDGTRVYALTNTTPVYDDRGNVSKALSMGVDITERKHAEQYQRELDQHKREFYRRTIMAATDDRLIISEREEIGQIAGPPVREWEIVDGEELATIRHEVMEFAQSTGMDEARVYDFILAVGEMSTNAFKHAGRGQASLHRPDDRLIFVVADEGPGMEALTLPEVALVRGFSTAGTLGMGYKAVLSVADRVYLATGPWGTTVAVEMGLTPTRKPTAIPDTWARQA